MVANATISSTELPPTDHDPHRPTWIAGSRVSVVGQNADISAYCDRLGFAEESTRITSSRRSQEHPHIRVRFCAPFAPNDATNSASSGKRIDSNGSVYVPTKTAWIKVSRKGERHWEIERSNCERLDIDRALIHILGLSSDILPLHASVANLNSKGIATIGSSSGGKTTVLLGLLEQGAHWVSDDTASYYSSLNEVVAGQSSIDAKWRYLRDIAELRRQVTWEEQLKLNMHPTVRKIAGLISEFRLPGRISRKLNRVRNGESRVTISPPNWRPSTNLDIVILAGEGECPSVREISQQSAKYPIARLLYDEVKSIAEINEEVLATGAAPLLDPWADHEQQISELSSLMLANKSIFVLSRPANCSMHDINELLSAVVLEVNRSQTVQSNCA